MRIFLFSVGRLVDSTSANDHLQRIFSEELYLVDWDHHHHHHHHHQQISSRRKS